MNHFIQYENQVFQLEHVSNAVYKKVSNEDAFMLGIRSNDQEGAILYVFLVNGRELRFVNEAADQVWGAIKASALNITPRKAAVDNE